MEPPACEAIWSSRDVVGEQYLGAFSTVAQRVVASESGDPGAVLAIRSSTGLLSTAHGASLEALEASDLLAVLDVDPVKQVMMVRGPGEPSPWAALMCMVGRYREDITAMVFLPTPADGPRGQTGTPGQGMQPQKAEGDGGEDPADVQQRDLPSSAMKSTRSRGWGFQEPAPPEDAGAKGTTGLVEWATRALEALRHTSVAVLPDGQVLSVGTDLQSAEGAIRSDKVQSRQGYGQSAKP